MFTYNLVNFFKLIFEVRRRAIGSIEILILPYSLASCGGWSPASTFSIRKGCEGRGFLRCVLRIFYIGDVMVVGDGCVKGGSYIGVGVYVVIVLSSTTIQLT